MTPDCCYHCDDGDGRCVFPYYGVAPHTHEMPRHARTPDWLGSTRLLPREQWGDNFREDPDCPGQGTYLRCEHCGRGEPVGQAASGTHCSLEVLRGLAQPEVVRHEIRGENGDLLEVSIRSGPVIHAKWGAAFDAELQAHPGIRKLADGSKP